MNKYAQRAVKRSAEGQLFSILVAHGQAENPFAGRCPPEVQQQRLKDKGQCPGKIVAQQCPHPKALFIRINPKSPQRDHTPNKAIQRLVEPARKIPPPRAARGRDAVLLAGRRHGIGRQHGDGQVFVHVQPVPLGAVVADRAAGRIRLLSLADVLLEHVKLSGRGIRQGVLPCLHRADLGDRNPQLPQQAHLAQSLHIRFRVIAVAVRAARGRDQPLLFVEPDVRARQPGPAFHLRYIHCSHLPFLCLHYRG